MPESRRDDRIRRVSLSSKVFAHVHAGAEPLWGGEDGFGEGGFKEEAVVTTRWYGIPV